LPRVLDEVLEGEGALASLGRRLAKASDLFFLGRGLHVATALEAALKFKEITYRHAEGFGAAELKHGTFALLSAETPCLFFLGRDDNYERVVANLVEVQSRGAPTFAVTQGGLEDVAHLVVEAVEVPATHPQLAGVPFLLVAQLLAYHAAVALGRDVDMPRNLAKSVTVE
ncbi:MAG TPA: SIS domain-containing protein, partial [Candidatus Thermoplasmatota archaeon]|nr:SIS domain-containing protein [Candidatus Thermoplasmatota archaeon]